MFFILIHQKESEDKGGLFKCNQEITHKDYIVLKGVVVTPLGIDIFFPIMLHSSNLESYYATHRRKNANRHSVKLIW